MMDIQHLVHKRSIVLIQHHPPKECRTVSIGNMMIKQLKSSRPIYSLEERMIKMRKWHKLSAIALSSAIVLGFATYSFAANSSPKNKVDVQAHKTYKEIEKPETQKMLEKSWAKGKDKLKGIKGEKIKDWQVIDAGDVDIEFIKNLPQEEASSFLNAFYSDSRKNNIHIGDRMPALLLSPSKDEGILVWERESGNIVYFELTSILQSDGTRVWSNGPAIELTS